MFEIKFADIGEGLTEGIVQEVYVKIGAIVKTGDVLFNVETDKITSDISTPIDGKISKILISQGQEIKVGQVVIEIDDEKENAEENASVVGSTPVSNQLLQRTRPNITISNLTINSQSNTQDQTTDLNYFDVIIIGAGIGGYVCAIKCSQLGLKTLIIEKNEYGGVCLNVGCIPTKALLKSTDFFDQINKSAEELGINVKDTNFDWDKIQKRKQNIVNKLSNGVEGLLKKYKIQTIKGEAKIIASNLVKINKTEYKCNNLVIATGSSPNSLNVQGSAEAIKDNFLINSTDILSLKKVPKDLIIIGGGVIGIEFAYVYKRLGTKVTILQALPTILEMFDEDIIKFMNKELKATKNFDIITEVEIVEFKNNQVTYKKNNKLYSISADYCLQSVGRKVNTDDFKILNIELLNNSFIKINKYCETNIVNVYAIGDVTGKMMLAHVASKHGVIVANRIAKKMNLNKAQDIKIDYNKVPSCIYTNPEVAFIGKSEKQLKKEGIEYKTYRFPLAVVGKALADGKTSGFIKIICELKYNQILGAHIIASTATEMISEIAAIMECEGTISELSKVIHPHPSLSEAIGEAAEALESGLPINF